MFTEGLFSGTVTYARAAEGKGKGLEYRVLFSDGYTEWLSDLELGQGMAMYKIANAHVQSNIEKENTDGAEGHQGDSDAAEEDAITTMTV